MKKLITLSLLAALAATPVLAATTSEDIHADKAAIHKDNKVIAKRNHKIAHHRAKKAAAKASGDHVEQAGQSVAIGTHQALKGEKQMEKNADQKILEHDATH